MAEEWSKCYVPQNQMKKKQGQTVYKTAIQIKRLYEYRQNDEGSEKGKDKESMLV